MKIAVLSGKGGTGKTFVSVNLANVCENATYKDCDVEEPNGHLFLKPDNITEQTVSRSLPCFDKDKCTSCRKCVDFCHFNAIALIKGKPLLFNEVCHSCGGCEMLCPSGAICEKSVPVGKVLTGKHNSITCVTGIMDMGQASGIPVINAVLGVKSDNDFEIIDCPPGSACSVMDSVKGSDICIIVGEPTLFGLHNFKMVLKLVRLLNKPCYVVINKYGDGLDPLTEYCKENNIDVICKIPFSKKTADLNARAEIVTDKDEEIKKIFINLLSAIKKEALKL